jgi:hypothetical protein
MRLPQQILKRRGKFVHEEEKREKDEKKDKEINNLSNMANFCFFAHYVRLEKLYGGKLSTGVTSISNYLPAVCELMIKYEDRRQTDRRQKRKHKTEDMRLILLSYKLVDD